MKKAIVSLIKSLHKKEQGMMLISVILLLALMGIIIAPLLGFMNTGLKVTQAKEIKTEQLYAAEAGVEDALWKIQDNTAPSLPKDASDPVLTYTLADNVNNKTVNVSITRISSDTFKVASVATGPSAGNSTSIESHLEIIDLTMFTSGAITSPTSINLQGSGGSSSTVIGDIWTPGFNPTQTSQVTGSINQTAVSDWPDARDSSQIALYYPMQVDTYSPYSATTINVGLSGQNGPLYVYNPSPPSTYIFTGNGSLQGTIYVAGDLYLDRYTDLELNGNTIFVEGDLTTDPAVYLNGPGCIIALGDVVFQPRLESSAYIYVMSVNGRAEFQPLSNFTGSVAGQTQVDVQPNCHIAYPASGAPSNLNLPGMGSNVIAEIKDWIIK